MGRVHTEGVRRLGNVEVAGVAASSAAKARAFADELSVAGSAGDYREFSRTPPSTPSTSALPTPCISPWPKPRSKPASMCSAKKPSRSPPRRLPRWCGSRRKRISPTAPSQSPLLPAGAEHAPYARSGRAGRDLRRAGHLLAGLAALRHRLQLAHRARPNGPSRAFADIGTHWCDMVEHITGLRITSLCADLQTFHKRAKKPKGIGRNLHGQDARSFRVHGGAHRHRRISAP